MNIISLKEFLHYFTDQPRDDKKFCFILGAGASKSSGIPTGGELAKEWFAQMPAIYPQPELDNWITGKKIDPDDLATSYCDIYDKRFSIRKEDGYAYLEEVMKGRNPSVGYSFLAQILAQGKHRVVITTNFDSLTEDALFIYTDKKPLVVGHENLAQYIKAFGQRPVVIKVHRDLLLSPRNDVDGTSRLADEFAKNLEAVLKYFTPVVIGYGGNDGGFMDFLEKLDEINGGIFWFYREPDKPNEKIQKLVEKFDGRFVAITGFDDFMIQLGNQLKLEKLDKRITDIAENRAKIYREQIEAITKAPKDYETEEALSNIVQRGEPNWWSYQLKVNETNDPDEKDRIYRAGLTQFPKSHELMGNYAVFLKNIRGDYDRAEEFYKKAIELTPGDAITVGNYAAFLTDIRKDYDRAEEFYKKAIELDPDHANNVGNYAFFLTSIRRDHDRAEEFYKKVIELDPDHANNVENYAFFLTSIRKDYDRAEEFHKKAIELDPDNPDHLGNYALLNIGKGKLADAKRLINEAFEKNAEHENEQLSLELWFYCYAIFPEDYPQSREKIEEYLSKGVQSIGWNLDSVLAAAKKRKHPRYDDLVEYARRITGDKD